MSDSGIFLQIKKTEVNGIHSKYMYHTFFSILLTPNKTINNEYQKDKYIDYINTFDDKYLLTSKDLKIEKNKPLPFIYVDYILLIDWDTKNILLFNDYFNFDKKFISFLLKDIQKIWIDWKINYCWGGIKQILSHLKLIHKEYELSPTLQFNNSGIYFEKKQDYTIVTKEETKIEFDENMKYDDTYFIYRENRYIDFFITLLTKNNTVKNYSVTDYTILQLGNDLLIELENKPTIDSPHLIDDTVVSGIIINEELKKIDIWWTKTSDSEYILQSLKKYWPSWTINQLKNGLEEHLQKTTQYNQEDKIRLEKNYKEFINNYLK